MRLHTDKITSSDIHMAAIVARVAPVEFSRHGSRKRSHAFEVKLIGESKRHPNAGAARGYFDQDVYAATWDQWGVFLAHLFAIDPNMTCWAYDGAADYAARTADRFGAPEDVMTADGYVRRFVSYGWPDDAHGDHSWQWQDGSRTCRRCSAEERSPGVAAQYV